MQIRKIAKSWGLILLQSILITGIVVFSVIPVSCKITAAGIEVIGGDYTAPVLQSITVVDEKNVLINFSEEVSLISAVVSPVIPGLSDSDVHSDTEELSIAIGSASGEYGQIDFEVLTKESVSQLHFFFEQGTEIGKQYEILGTVKDKIGNSLTFCVPFTGYNSRIPKIIMTELHTGMASQLASEKKDNIRRLEYIEFLALSDGNLVGLELWSGAYGESKKYAFPPVEVSKGESFVLHLRNWGEGCISEEEDNLSLAFSEYTSDVVRDFWTKETTKCIGDKTDMVIVRNLVSGKIVDGVMYRDEAIENWSDKLKINFSDQDGFTDIYVSGGDIDNAVNASALSSTYALQRNDKEEILNKILSDEEIEYPISVTEETWKIGKPSLPLKS